MRSQTIQNISTITYPDICCFAYNDQYVTVESKSIKKVIVRVTDVRRPMKYFDLGAVLYKEKASINIKDALTAIADNEINKRWSYVHVAVLHNNVALAGFHTYAIYGGIDLNRYFKTKGTMPTINGASCFVRKATWFKQYPFSVSFFTRDTSDPINCVIDGATQKTVTHARILDDISSTQFSDATQKIRITSSKASGAYKLFDKSFDKTFTETYGSEISEVVDIKVSNDTEGIYMRWIDECGYLQYYLFAISTIELSSTNSENRKDVNTEYQISTPLYTTLTKSITCAAVSVDADMLFLLDSVINSPKVDMYENGAWQNVNVMNATKVNSKVVRQNFEITIQYELNLQTIL